MISSEGCLTQSRRVATLAFRDFSSLRTHFRPAYCIRRLYGAMAHVKTSGFLTVLQKASPATQQLMALENKFIAMFPSNRS
jgi:hypothetical protein